MITLAQFVGTVLSEIQRIEGSAPDVFEGDVQNILPRAMIRLAESTWQHVTKANRLTKDFDCTLDSDGRGEVESSSTPHILTSALVNSLARVYSDAPTGARDDSYEEAIYKANFHEVENPRYYLNEEFYYYAVQGNKIIVRGNGTSGEGMRVRLTTTYIPDFTSSYPLPYDLVDDAVQIAKDLLMPVRTK